MKKLFSILVISYFLFAIVYAGGEEDGGHHGGGHHGGGHDNDHDGDNDNDNDNDNCNTGSPDLTCLCDSCNCIHTCDDPFDRFDRQQECESTRFNSFQDCMNNCRNEDGAHCCSEHNPDCPTCQDRDLSWVKCKHSSSHGDN